MENISWEKGQIWRRPRGIARNDWPNVPKEPKVQNMYKYEKLKIHHYLNVHKRSQNACYDEIAGQRSHKKIRRIVNKLLFLIKKFNKVLFTFTQICTPISKDPTYKSIIKYKS